MESVEGNPVWARSSLENLGVKVNAALVVNYITDLNGIAANLTVLYISLAAHRCVQYH
jgi:hypothetical protein